MNSPTHEHDRCLYPEASPASEEMLCDLADLFKIFGDTTRLRILFALLDTEMCVMHISERLGMTSSAISHQLKVLKDNNLVACRREGKTISITLPTITFTPSSRRGMSILKKRKEPKNEKDIPA